MTYWTPGTQIQWIYRGRTPGVDNVRPMTVVRDDPDGLVAWLAGGTPLIKPVLTDGRDIREAGPGRMFLEPRVAMLSNWRGHGVLKVAPSGSPGRSGTSGGPTVPSAAGTSTSNGHTAAMSPPGRRRPRTACSTCG